MFDLITCIRKKLSWFKIKEIFNEIMKYEGSLNNYAMTTKTFGIDISGMLTVDAIQDEFCWLE